MEAKRKLSLYHPVRRTEEEAPPQEHCSTAFHRDLAMLHWVLAIVATYWLPPPPLRLQLLQPPPPPLPLWLQLLQPPLLSFLLASGLLTGMWIVAPLSSITSTDSWGTLTETTLPGPLGVLRMAPICGSDCLAW